MSSLYQDLSKFDEAQLTQLRTNVDEALVTLAERRKADALAQAEEVATAAGFTLQELIGGKAPAKRKTTPKDPTAPRAPRVAKYRHPTDSSLEWSGMGHRPKWLKKEIENGKSVEDFRI